MKKDLWIVVFLVFFLIILSSLSPTTIYATNGHQLSAIGAYMEGMGGATTAAPYDASTSITNPAGMALIGNRTDFSFMTFFPKRTLQFAGGEETFGGSPLYLVPAVGWTAPVNDRGDLFFGGGMYGVSGMGVDYGTISAPFLAGAPYLWTGPQAHVWSQYQFWKMAPTLAGKSGKLAWGIALNFDYQAFGFKQVFTDQSGDPTHRFGFDLSTMQGTLGYGATVGAIYEIRPEITVGASYSSKQRFGDFKWRLAQGDVINPESNQMNLDGMYKMKLDFPQQAAVGIAVRPVKKLLWTADVKWINYHDTYNIVKLRGNFAGPPGTDPNSTDLVFGWNNVWVYATGLQLDVTPKLAVRAGYNHSTSPMNNDDVEHNIALPAIVTDRASAGFTYRLGRHWEYTLAFMKAFRKQMTGDYGTTISLEEQATDFELSYRF